MRIRILGAAAGGGLPQWNCRCGNCEAARDFARTAGSVRPRTQSSVAVSIDQRTWFLLNASPDIRQQILDFPALGPSQLGQRGHAIAGCILTDAEFDHTLGLLLLREGPPFKIFATSLVRSWLNRFHPVEALLASFSQPVWADLPLDEPLLLTGEGNTGLCVRAFEVQPHRPRFVSADSDLAGSVVGLTLEDRTTGGKLVYAPCVGGLEGRLLAEAKTAAAVLVDGTFWSNDEPLHFGKRTALDMGHAPVSGSDGTLAWLAELPVRHRVYVHINNTNPMVNEQGAEHALVRAGGVRVGADGDMFDV